VEIEREHDADVRDPRVVAQRLERRGHLLLGEPIDVIDHDDDALADLLRHLDQLGARRLGRALDAREIDLHTGEPHDVGDETAVAREAIADRVRRVDDAGRGEELGERGEHRVHQLRGTGVACGVERHDGDVTARDQQLGRDPQDRRLARAAATDEPDRPRRGERLGARELGESLGDRRAREQILRRAGDRDIGEELDAGIDHDMAARRRSRANARTTRPPMPTAPQSSMTSVCP
jgi:hypothetical protein